MRHIILDTNIILQMPEILSQNIENVKLIIPDTVLDEIRNITVHGNYSQDLRKLIYEAASTNFVEIFDARSFISTKFDSNIYLEKLSSNDVILIKFYESFRKKINSDSFLATDDKSIILFLKQLKLDVITSDELRKLFFSAKITSKQLLYEIEVLKKRFKKRIFLSFFAGIILTLVVVLGYFYIEQIVATLNIWGTTAIIPLMGIFFFYIRARWRLFYGVTEFLVGIFTAVLIFLPAFDYNTLISKPFSFLQILGGLYIMVRGLDNIGIGLRATKFEKLWRRIFGYYSI